MRKVYVNVTTKLKINKPRGRDIDDVLADMDYNFVSITDGGNVVEDTEIREWTVIRNDKGMDLVVHVITRLILNLDEGTEVSQVIENMDYHFTSQTEECEITDTEIIDYDITDSK